MAVETETIEIHPAAAAMEAKSMVAYLTQRNLLLAHRIVRLEQERQELEHALAHEREVTNGDTA